MKRYTWSQAVWRAKRIAQQIGRTVFLLEHDGRPIHDRFSVSLEKLERFDARLRVALNGNTW